MGMKKIVLRPGVNTELSPTLNEGGVSGSNLIRYRGGLPEKIGGWGRLSNTNVIGTVRSMHAWADLSGLTYLAYGSDKRLQVLSGGTVFDLTPLRRTINVANILSTVISTPNVTVADPSHGAAIGDSIIVVIPVAIGGLVIFGNYTVATVPDANHYTFVAASNATATVNLAGTLPGFSTVNTLNVVTVNLPAHGLSIGNIFTIQVSVTVGGLTLVGQFLVNTIVDANNFTIQASSVATSTAGPVLENSGNVEIQYLLTSGYASDTAVIGWGGGTWGAGTWGMSGGSTFTVPLRNWSLDNFGQNLVAVPTNGALYQWVPPAATGNVATVVTQAPSVNWGLFVAMPQEQVVLFGSSVAGVQDPLLIAWCDAGIITVWTATAANQAGTFRLSRGSKIVGGLQMPHTALIWTDIDLWSMTYIQPPFIYDFEIVASGCGLVAKGAAAILGDAIFWMSQKSFFVLDGGGVRPLKCDVWDAIFKNLTTTQLSKIICAPNSNFNEVSWFYPSLTGNGEIDSYVKYNTLDKVWDYGSLIRTAWIDQSVLGSPIGVDGPNGLLQQHETAVDADGQPMTGVEITTGYSDLEDGSDYVFIDKLIPDFVWTGSANTAARSVTLTVYGLDYPGDLDGGLQGIYGPFTMNSQTQYITLRARFRQIAFKIQCDGLGTFWRLGAMRYRGAPDGRL